MSNTILLKRNGNAAAVPVAANLTLGELSLNYADGKLYFLNSSNVVTVLASSNTASGTQLINGTSNVVVASGSNVTISSAGTANVLLISSTGTVTSGTASVTGNITGSYFIGNGSQLTGISAGGGGNSISNGTSNVVVASGGNISMAVAGANVITIASTGIINNQANGVGNIGSSTGYFNTVFAKATSAQYADLAEMYVADQNYPAGTVVEFSGNFEITATTQTHSTRTAGIVSTSPSYLMNSTQEGEHVLPIALTGRVPCQVVGTIRKGDRLVSSGIPGVATALDKTLYEPGCIIGKALEDYDSINNGIIEVAVGRF